MSGAHPTTTSVSPSPSGVKAALRGPTAGPKGRSGVERALIAPPGAKAEGRGRSPERGCNPAQRRAPLPFLRVLCGCRR